MPSIDRPAGGPRRFRVTVRGRLSGRAIALLDDTLLDDTLPDHVAVHHDGELTSIVANIVDQADLYGLLDVLQGMGIELVSIAELPSE